MSEEEKEKLRLKNNESHRKSYQKNKTPTNTKQTPTSTKPASTDTKEQHSEESNFISPVSTGRMANRIRRELNSDSAFQNFTNSCVKACKDIPTPVPTLTDEVKRIHEFYRSDLISRASACARDVVVIHGETKVYRYLEFTLDELVVLYHDQYGPDAACRTTLWNHKPEDVKWGKFSKQVIIYLFIMVVRMQLLV